MIQGDKPIGYVTPRLVKFEEGPVSGVAEPYQVFVEDDEPLRDVLSSMLMDSMTTYCVVDENGSFKGSITYQNIQKKNSGTIRRRYGLGGELFMEILEFIRENIDQILFLTWEHVWIVFLSLFIAMLTGIPTGIAITRNEVLAKKVLYTANIFMTIPSIAMFGILLPILAPMGWGLGKVPAVIALVLYSELPIIRNTYIAIKNVDPALVDAGKGLGLTRWETPEGGGDSIGHPGDPGRAQDRCGDEHRHRGHRRLYRGRRPGGVNPAGNRKVL